MKELSSADRKNLRALAHHLDPVCHLGKDGLTEAAVRSIMLALDAHELVKVKFQDFKSEKRSLSSRIEELTQSHLVGLIGNIAIFYRENPDAERRKISL